MSTAASPTPSTDDRPMSPQEDDDDSQLSTEEREWDEGGPSHCGYHETVHETLMTVGSSVNDVVGEPSDGTKTSMTRVGNWFQEASYAIRDFMRGNSDLQESTMETAATMQKDAGLAMASMTSSLGMGGSKQQQQQGGEGTSGGNGSSSGGGAQPEKQ